MKKFMIILAGSLLAGCAGGISVCPLFPGPSKEVLVKIDSLKDPAVDAWMEKIYKLNLKLRSSNEH